MMGGLGWQAELGRRKWSANHPALSAVSKALPLDSGTERPPSTAIRRGNNMHLTAITNSKPACLKCTLHPVSVP